METQLPKSKVPWYYPFFGILILLFISNTFFKTINTVEASENKQRTELTLNLPDEQDEIQAYLNTLDFKKSGLRFLELKNRPYPLFYISVANASVLRDNALLPILERLVIQNGIQDDITLKTDFFSNGFKSPAEVRFVLDENFDRVVAKKVFTIKKGDSWNRQFVFEERY